MQKVQIAMEVYFVTPSLIGRAHTQNDPWIWDVASDWQVEPAVWLVDLNLDWETPPIQWILGNLQCIMVSWKEEEISTWFQNRLTIPL